jgi:peroxiredoxin
MNPYLIAPGQHAPDFDLNDINGNTIRLSSFRGSKPVLLAFLRGFM